MSKSTSKRTVTSDSTSALAVYRRLFRYVWRYRLVFGISILALVVLSATNTGFLAGIKQVTDEGFANKNPEKLAWFPLLLFGLMAVRAIAGFISTMAARWVARRVVENVRCDAFESLMALPINYYDANSAGIITSKLTNDVEGVAKASTNVVISAVRDSLTALGMIGYMLYLDWRLTLIFAVTIPFMGFYLKKMTPKIRAAGRQVQDTMGVITKVSEEAISGQRMVKIFGGENYELRRFSRAVADNRKTHLKFIRRSQLNSFVIEFLAAIALGLVVFYATGRFTAGGFAAFLTALLMLIQAIKSLASINEDVQSAVAAAQSMFSLMDSNHEIDEGSAEIGRVKGSIEFRNVTLRYENAKRDAITNLSVTVQPGEKVALVGRSGGGKSTLVNLLPRFYEMQQGVILLDGIDTRTLTLKNLRQQFALVSQEVVLFNDTVFNNVAYGDLRDTPEEKVIAAAKAAYAWEFIQHLPNGLHTEIGDRGVRLSGGQRQRLAIARAILKDAPILLLDEATSALDTESEQHVQKALDELMRNRTSIVIAHRLSTIENADRILVMEQGEIVESGTHEELLALNGHYTKLYRKQFH
ncbi:MAG: lipid A export permease/ATP-binding protein MsbA [Methylobacillus sp.]|jgi:subfamily B ATP-binding cassette protein MsbA|nr:lipid A export permease/ATP-binding protein MsbA [Methylobacillus sp.]